MKKQVLMLLFPLLFTSCGEGFKPVSKLIFPNVYEGQKYVVLRNYQSDGNFEIPFRSESELVLDDIKTATGYFEKEPVKLVVDSLEKIQNYDYLLSLKATDKQLQLDTVELTMSDKTKYSVPVCIELDHVNSDYTFQSKGIEIKEKETLGYNFEVSYDFKITKETIVDFRRSPALSYSPLLHCSKVMVSHLTSPGSSVTESAEPKDGFYDFRPGIDYTITVSFQEIFHAHFFNDFFSLYGKTEGAETIYYAKPSQDVFVKEFKVVF